jgi:hypothetical protein
MADKTTETKDPYADRRAKGAATETKDPYADRRAKAKAKVRVEEAQRISDVKESPVETPTQSKKGGVMRLGDAKSLQPIKLSEEEAATVAEEKSIFGMSAAQRKVYENMPPIGAFESFLDSDIARAARYLDPRKIFDKKDINDAPGVFNILAVKAAVDSLTLANYKDGHGMTAAERAEADIATVNGYMEQLEARQIRGTEFMGKVTAGGMDLPVFMAEFYATGGLATLGKIGATKGLRKILTKHTQSKIKTAIVKTGQLGASASVRTALLGPHLITEGYNERQVQSQLIMTKKGMTLAEEARETPWTSFMKAGLDTWIEMFSEETGKYISAAGKLVGKGIGKAAPSSFRNNTLVQWLQQAYLKLHPKGKLKDLTNKIALDNYFSELGEELFGDIGRAALGVDDFGAGKEGTGMFGLDKSKLDPNSRVDRILAAFRNGDEMAVEMSVLALPTAGMGGLQALSKMRNTRKHNGKDVDNDGTPYDESKLDSFLNKHKEGETKEAPSNADLSEQVGAEVDPNAKKTTTPKDFFKDFDAAREKETEAKPEEGKQVPAVRPKKRKVKELLPEPTEAEEAELSPEENAVVIARGAQIQKEADVIVEQITEIDTDILARETEGKSTKALENKKAKLEDSLIDLEVETEDVSKALGDKNRLEVERDINSFVDNLTIEKEEDIDVAVDQIIGHLEKTLPEATNIKPYLTILNKVKRTKTEAELKDPKNKSKLQDFVDAMVDIKKKHKKIKFVHTTKKLLINVGQMMKALGDVFKAGKAESKTVLKKAKEIQTKLIEAIKLAVPDKADHGAFLNLVKNVQTKEQYDKVKPLLEAKIKHFQNKAEERQVKKVAKRIKDQLKAAKVRMSSGKKRGKYTPALQKAFDTLREVSQMTKEQAFTELRGNLKALGPTPATPEQWLRNSLLQTASGLSERTSKELEAISEWIRIKMAMGKLEHKAKELAKKEMKDKEKAIASKSIGKNRRGASEMVKAVARWFRSKAAGGKGSVGWDDIISVISMHDTDIQGDYGHTPMTALGRLFQVTHIEQKEKAGIIEKSTILHDNASLAYGTKDGRQTLKELNQASKVENLGLFPDALSLSTPEGHQDDVRISISRLEAVDLAMKLKDPALAEVLKSEKGGLVLGGVEINGLTDAMIDAITGELGLMTKGDHRLADSLFKFYENYHAQLNEIYKERYGVELDKLDFYSPVSRFVDGTLVESFLEDLGFRASIDPSSFKSRVQSGVKLTIKSAYSRAESHIVSMENFIHWNQMIDRMNNVFADASIRLSIVDRFGKPMLDVIDMYRLRYINNIESNANLLTLLDKMRTQYTRSALMLNPALVPKQMASFLTYQENIPPADFAAGLADFLANWKYYRDLLSKTDFMIARGSSMTPDISDAVDSRGGKNVSDLKNIHDIMSFGITQFGDRWAIYLGGGALYSAVLKETGSHEKAELAFVEASSSTQQSADKSKKSDFQGRGPVFKVFQSFQTSQNQYLRKELWAFRELVMAVVNAKTVKGRSKAFAKALPRFMKMMVIYHVSVPVLFQFISDGFEWDDDEQKRAAILGSTNGYFIINDLISYAYREIAHAHGSGISTYDPLASVTPLYGILKGVQAASRDIDLYEPDLDDYRDAAETFLSNKYLWEKTIGPLTGLNIRQLNNFREGLEDYLEMDKKAKGLWKMYGLPRGTANKKFDD